MKRKFYIVAARSPRNIKKLHVFLAGFTGHYREITNEERLKADKTGLYNTGK